MRNLRLEVCSFIDLRNLEAAKGSTVQYYDIHIPGQANVRGIYTRSKSQGLIISKDTLAICKYDAARLLQYYHDLHKEQI